MKVNLGINDKNRKQVCELLNILLADEYTLYTKTLKFHWNVYGPQFHDLHVFFRHLYESLFLITDDIAERVRTMGGEAFGTFAEFAKNTHLEENPGNNPKALNMIAILLADHETVIKELRQAADITQELNDAGTNNFLIEILEKHEKMAWMLRSCLE